MKQINIYGPFFGSSGYDVHTRNLANALSKLNYTICMNTQMVPNWVRLVSDNEYQMFNKESVKGDVNLMIGTPNAWPLVMCEDKPFIGFVVWEGDRVPEFWMPILIDKRVSQIWVPSQHVKDAIINTHKNSLYEVLTLPEIFIVPHGVDNDLFKPMEEIKKNSKFTILLNGGWVHSWKDRKGLSYAIKAFAEEFNKEENVRLLVKINATYGGDVNKNIIDLKVENKNTAEINMIAQQIDYKLLPKIYNEANVFVNTSLADGFNLNCIEAQACGLPVITTTFGGQSDFCNEETGYLLKEGTMKENKWDMMYEGISWKEPDINEIRKTMRYAFEHPEESKTKGLVALENSKDWTWDCSALKAKEALDKLK